MGGWLGGKGRRVEGWVLVGGVLSWLLGVMVGLGLFECCWD